MQETVTKERLQKSFEDKVILTTTILSFVVALALFLWSNIPGTSTVVATFLGLGLSAMVYRFLGGIGETSFQLKAWKVAGTGAFLIGTIWFIDYSMKGQVAIEPPLNNAAWFAMDAQGLPLRVSLDNATAIEKPNANIFKNLNLEISREPRGLVVFAEKDCVVFRHGFLSNQRLEEENVFSDVEVTINPNSFVVLDSLLRPGTPFYDLDPLPLRISTKNYGGGYTRFVIEDKITKTPYPGEIRERGAAIFRIGGKTYFVAVVQVDHRPMDNRKKYAKFAVAELHVVKK